MNLEDLIHRLTDPDREVRQGVFDEIPVEMDDALAAAIADIAGGEYPDIVRADAIVALGPLVRRGWGLRRWSAGILPACRRASSPATR